MKKVCVSCNQKVRYNEEWGRCYNGIIHKECFQEEIVDNPEEYYGDKYVPIREPKYRLRKMIRRNKVYQAIYRKLTEKRRLIAMLEESNRIMNNLAFVNELHYTGALRAIEEGNRRELMSEISAQNVAVQRYKAMVNHMWKHVEKNKKQ